MTITIRQLSYFVALAEARSFGAAARRVHVTQPALSQQIKELEANLGAVLVERLPREIRLTRAGRILLEHARRILRDLGDAEQAVRLQSGLAGRLSLGVIPTIAPYLLPLTLTRLRARDVTLDIRVREAQTARLVDDLIDGRLDAVVIALPAPRPGLVTKPLFQDRFLLAGSETRLAGLAGVRSPGQVPLDQLLLLDEGHCLADQALEAVCGLVNRPMRVDLGASSLSTLCGLVAEGFGLTFLPELAVRTETAAAPGLRLRRFADPEPSRTVALARRASSQDDGWMQELAAILRDAAAELLDHASTAGRD